MLNPTAQNLANHYEKMKENEFGQIPIPCAKCGIKIMRSLQGMGGNLKMGRNPSCFDCKVKAKHEYYLKHLKKPIHGKIK